METLNEIRFLKSAPKQDGRPLQALAHVPAADLNYGAQPLPQRRAVYFRGNHRGWIIRSRVELAAAGAPPTDQAATVTSSTRFTLLLLLCERNILITYQWHKNMNDS